MSRKSLTDRVQRVQRLRRILSARLWTDYEAAQVHHAFVNGADTAELARVYEAHESDILRALDQHRVAMRGK